MLNLKAMSNEHKYREIIASTSARVCVIAGPGTGKTKGVLIPKTEALIADGVAPTEILLLSFSRLSALDLKSRVQGTITASTVHSCCLAFLLSENNHDIRNRIDSLVLDFEENALVCDLKLVFPHVHKNDLRDMLAQYKAGWATAQQDTVLEHNDQEQRFKYAVMNWLKEHNAALLGEIMYSGVELIKQLGNTGMLEKFKYILVDEYQDLNKLEQEFVAQIATHAQLLLVVGDPDQSIYSFKFAHPDGILDFETSADSHFLEYCGRCGKKIVAIANQLLIQADPSRTTLPKPLPGNCEGEVILHPPFQDQEAEFRYVIDTVIEKVKKGVKSEEILILVPKKRLADELIKTITEQDRKLLAENNAAIEIASKSGFSDAEIASILLFALVANPKSLLHVRSYVGLNDDNAFATELLQLKTTYGDLQGAIGRANPDDFPKRNKRVRGVCKVLVDLREAIRAHEGSSIEDVIDSLFTTSNEHLIWIHDVLRAMKEEDDTITSLHRKFTDYVRSSPQKPGIVRIMTLGLSKGLDAEHVYIVGASSGNIPGKNYSIHLSDSEFLKEQRRILYVGMTRAKLSLTITWSRYISFQQSQSHQTGHVGVRRISGRAPEVRLSLCEFLQGITF